MAQRNHRNAASRPSIYQTVTGRILSSLKAGVIPWEKPWKSPRFTGGPFPRNFYTGKPYRGINVLLLCGRVNIASRSGLRRWPSSLKARRRKGTRLEGFAPTSRAAQKLADAGMETSTLQKHLARGQQPDTGERRLYVLDESSLASTRQMHEFVHRLNPNDRVLLVGDRRQHEALEAGRPFTQLQDAGMKTVKLEEIVRQKNPELKQVVEQLARGEVREAVRGLERQGRVHEIAGHEERITAIAKEYAKSPEGTLVVSPDNRSRVEINLAIRAEMQERGLVSKDEHRIEALAPRQDLTGPERTWAARYEFNDVVRYARASKETGMERGEYARVKSVDADKNLVSIRISITTMR